MVHLVRSSLVTAAIAAAVLGALAVQAASARPARPARACFFASQLSSWKEVGDRTVNLRVGVNDVYQLQLLSRCPDLRYAEAVGVETRGGSSQICSGLDVNLIVPSSVTHSIPQRCMATSLRKLSRDEAKALPRGEKP